MPLLDYINNLTNFVTTSSCSGRISVFKTNAGVSKGGEWLYVEHEPRSLEEVTAEVIGVIFDGQSNSTTSSKELEPVETTPKETDLKFLMDAIAVAQNGHNTTKEHHCASSRYFRRVCGNKPDRGYDCDLSIQIRA